MERTVVNQTWLKIVLMLPMVNINFCFAMVPQLKNNPFDVLSKKAEEKYRTTGITENAPEAQKTSDKNVQQNDQQKKLNMINSMPSSEKPLLAQHKEFSDDWWDALFGTCTGCERLSPHFHDYIGKSKRIIDCQKLLESNKQWTEVEQMAPAAKSIIMQGALERFGYNKSNGICNLACAICAGGDPNERLSGRGPHTALHMVSEIGRPAPHYP